MASILLKKVKALPKSENGEPTKRELATRWKLRRRLRSLIVRTEVIPPLS